MKLPIRHLAPVAQASTMLTAAMLVFTAASFVLWTHDRRVIQENHIIEWTQAVFLLFAGLVHGYRAVPMGPRSIDSLVRSGLCLFCITVLLREMTIDKFGDPAIWLPVERGMRSLAGFAWILFMILLLSRMRPVWDQRREILLSPHIIVTLFGCVFYLVASVFEKPTFPISHEVAKFIEEVVELNATILLFAASIAGSAAKRKHEY